MSDGLLARIKVKPRELLFYMAFSLLTFVTIIDRSSLMGVPYYISDIVTVSVAVLFVIKILLDKHRIRELLLDAIFVIATIIIKIMGGPMFIMSSCLAFLAMKDINIKTVVKIDIAIKSFFLVILWLDCNKGCDSLFFEIICLSIIRPFLILKL